LGSELLSDRSIKGPTPACNSVITQLPNYPITQLPDHQTANCKQFTIYCQLIPRNAKHFNPERTGEKDGSRDIAAAVFFFVMSMGIITLWHPYFKNYEH
jgi:hypothetical protein